MSDGKEVNMRTGGGTGIPFTDPTGGTGGPQKVQSQEMRDVKRWETISIDTKIPGTRPDVDGVPRVTVVLASDFDRIMSERDELWKRATKFVMPGEMDTGESIEHYIKTLEQTVAELRAEVEKLRHDCGNHNISQADIDWCVLCDRKSNEATIATQARVIEKLKLAITDIAHKNTCWRLYGFHRYKSYEDGWEGVAEFAGKVLNELAAIEKEGAKDD